MRTVSRRHNRSVLALISGSHLFGKSPYVKRLTDPLAAIANFALTDIMARASFARWTEDDALTFPLV